MQILVVFVQLVRPNVQIVQRSRKLVCKNGTLKDQINTQTACRRGVGSSGLGFAGKALQVCFF